MKIKKIQDYQRRRKKVLTEVLDKGIDFQKKLDKKS